MGALTATGAKMVEFTLDPPLAKMLLSAAEMGCSNEVLTVVAMLSAGSPFFRPKEREEQSDAAREKFFVPESDHLTLLNVYTQWKNNGSRGDWCSTHFLHHKTISRARDIRSQLLDTMKQQRVPLNNSGTEWDIARVAICSAYFQNAARLKGIGEYVNCRSGAHTHPSFPPSRTPPHSRRRQCARAATTQACRATCTRPARCTASATRPTTSSTTCAPRLPAL